jgi:hypothetical protein
MSEESQDSFGKDQQDYKEKECLKYVTQETSGSPPGMLRLRRKAEAKSEDCTDHKLRTGRIQAHIPSLLWLTGSVRH